MRQRNVRIRTMATVWTAAALGLAFALASSAQGQPQTHRWHVDASVAGGNGLSWTDAFEYLQDAIDAAAATP